MVGTLEIIARIIEAQNPGYRCSILLVADGRFVRGAGPSLPEAYNAAIDGYAIGPMVGSCGTAIYWNIPVIVEDIQNDPLWADLVELAAQAGVAACWSHPFTSMGGCVLGALALYASEPQAPTQEQLDRLEAAARMTGLAVERGRAEEALLVKRKRELELEDQLRQAAKMEALGVLASGVAHDFNNVLSTILANAEFVRDVIDAGQDVEEMLTDIVMASRRAGEFCQQMLAYAGRGAIEKSRVELGALLPELNGLVRAAMSKKTTLSYALHEAPIFVEGDENQLLQIVMNLVTNAAEAIGENEGRIEVSTEVTHFESAELSRLDSHVELPSGEYVSLRVNDTGSGMDAATKARIFDPFFTTKFTGRGLGLAAVKGIVHGHQGIIYLQSKLGVGTTFTVLLPTIASEEPEATANREPVRHCVLLVDDETAIRNIFAKRLKRAGYDVVQAADGQQAIDMFTAQPDAISVVLLDVSMPKRSGIEVFGEMRFIRPDLPIILMSGLACRDIVHRLGRGKPTAVLQKPIAAAQLLGAVENAVTVA